MIILNVSGNLTADAIVKSVNGSQVVCFTIASNRRWKTQSGQLKEEVTFLSCQIWDKPESAKYLYKGRAVNAVGSFSLRKYQDAQGAEQTALNLRVSFFQLFGKNPATDQPTITNVQVAPPEGITSQQPAAEIHEDLPF